MQQTVSPREHQEAYLWVIIDEAEQKLDALGLPPKVWNLLRHQPDGDHMRLLTLPKEACETLGDLSRVQESGPERERVLDAWLEAEIAALASQALASESPMEMFCIGTTLESRLSVREIPAMRQKFEGEAVSRFTADIATSKGGSRSAHVLFLLHVIGTLKKSVNLGTVIKALEGFNETESNTLPKEFWGTYIEINAVNSEVTFHLPNRKPRSMQFSTLRNHISRFCSSSRKD